MNGVARTTGILDLWYGDDRLDARLGLKYHSSYTMLFTWASGDLQTVKAETMLDYSMGYKINEHLSLRFQAGNLLNTPLRLYDNNNPNEIARNDVYGRHYLLDVTLKL
jgi:outer membrane receptor protein involved in Fe transport